jgi:DNA-binding transcriptional regulator YhcF (GntR family)
MSIKVMSWVWDHSKAKGAELLVLLAIADHASDNGGNAWPSQRTLARRARVTERSVQRAITSLVEAGELAVDSRSGGTQFTDPRYRPNRYQIVMNEGRQNVGSGELRPDIDDAKTRHSRHSDPTHVSYESSLEPSGTVRAARGDAGVGSQCEECGGDEWVFNDAGHAARCPQCCSPKLRAIAGGA